LFIFCSLRSLLFWHRLSSDDFPSGQRLFWGNARLTRSVTGTIMIATCGLKPGAGGPPGGGPGGIMTCGAVMPLDSPAGAAQTGHRP
jgi:hypothetical protein